MAKLGSNSGLFEELRTLYDRQEHEGLLNRCDRILNPSSKSRKAKSKSRRKSQKQPPSPSPDQTNDDKEKVLGDEEKQVVGMARAGALIMLGREVEALEAIDKVEEIGHCDAEVGEFMKRARPYAMWKKSLDLEKALELAKEIEGKDGRYITGQVLYRLGKYEEATEVYEELLRETEKELSDMKEKKRYGTGSRFGFVGRLGGRATSQGGDEVTETMIEDVEEGKAQLATNLTASLALKGDFDRVEKVGQLCKTSYEMQYNTACAAIESGKWDVAKSCLNIAEELLRKDAAEDGEEDIEVELTPLRVQKAYLLHNSNNIADAQAIYSTVVESQQTNSATLAVATNNLTVLQGQRLLRSGLQSQGENNSETEKESHNTIAEGVRRMKATAGWSVERKLTNRQRRAIARNRAILLVYANRYEACQAEVERLKSSFTEDPLVPMIEAAYLAKAKGYENADMALKAYKGDTNQSAQVAAARAQLAVDSGKPEVAAEIIGNTFSQNPAALATVAVLREAAGKRLDAAQILEKHDAIEAQRLRADILLRAEDYKGAADGYNNVLKLKPGSKHVLAHLIIATSHMNPEEAEKLLEQLNGNSWQMSSSKIDIKALEASQAPRKTRTRQAQTVQGADTSSPAIGKKKRKKRKKRLPKDYDPNGPPPDPERWLPKTLRSSYKKKRRRDAINFRGSQGADAAAVEEAAAKNAKKSAARSSKAEVDSTPTAPSRPRGKRKNRRRK